MILSKLITLRPVVVCLAMTIAAAHAPAPVQADAPADFPELAEGLEQIRDRQWEDAADWFYGFTRENPAHAEARRKQAYVELHRPGGDAVRARQYLEAAAQREPDDPVGLVMLGRTCVIAQDTACAMRAFERMIELGPGQRDPVRSNAVHLARFNLALLHVKAREADRARELFEAVLRREPLNAYASYELGLIDAAEGRTEQAVERLRAAEGNLNRWTALEIWAYPQERYSYARDDARYALARALITLGRSEEARPLLEPLVDLARARNASRSVAPPRSQRALIDGDITPRFENALFAWGEMLAALGETRDAAKAFKEFSRMRVGDAALKADAKKKARKLR